MRGIRLFPAYHGYTLDDSRFKQLVDLATKRGLLIQIAVTIEDERSQNPVLTSAPVNVAPLVDVATAQPRARIMLLNATSRLLGAGNPLLQRLAAAGVWFEIATLEGVAGIATLLAALPTLRLAFGSHSPYFYFESAWLKLRESALSAAQLAAVGHEHAEAALNETASAPTAR